MTLRPLAWLLLLAIAAPASQAQVLDPTSDVTVTATGAPEDPIAGGGNATVEITVDLEMTNIFCTADDSVTVDVAVEAAPSVPGVTANLLESSLTFDIPQGNYQGAGYDESQSTELNIELTPSVGNATQEYTVTATFAGGQVCTSSGEVPAAENSAAFTLNTMQAGPPPGTEDNETGGGGGGGGGIPGPGLPLTIVGVIALVAVLRRRD